MNQKQLLTKLYKLQVLKSLAKKRVQSAMDTLQTSIDALHELETSACLLIQEIQSKKRSQ